ncbi:unnamed protein product [Larinioides sclopetarius]|uniref:Uncharacterized protein n=1 Tax=Larinioides sclopetarius TaxID=280406 RepID=A0AAV1YRR3_9ARAC
MGILKVGMLAGWREGFFALRAAKYRDSNEVEFLAIFEMYLVGTKRTFDPTDSQKHRRYSYCASGIYGPTMKLLASRIWRENFFPQSWQKAIIVPILKPGKDREDPGNYRPIALTSCLSSVAPEDIAGKSSLRNK